MKLVVIGGMTIDDIVLSDGTFHRRVPGGNALYSALGAAVWGVQSDIISLVGADYPIEELSRLTKLGIGIGHISCIEGRSIRLWILYEEDGRRQIHLQHDSPGLQSLESSALSALDSLLRHPEGLSAAHIAALPVSFQRTIASRLTSAKVPFSLDTLEAKGSVGGDLADYLKVGQDMSPHVFLPSREEFSLLFGDDNSSRFRTWALTTQTETLVIKDGDLGSRIASPPSADFVHLAAVDCTVVDPTGAGDAYCGGYAAGMALGKTSLESAAMGTVSASFAIEDVGALGFSKVTPINRQYRLQTLINTVPKESR